MRFTLKTGKCTLRFNHYEVVRVRQPLLTRLLKLLFIALLLFSCHKSEQLNCDCEIVTDGDQQYITFMMRGCSYCCWYATIHYFPQERRGYPSDHVPETCFTPEQIDSIGDQFYQKTIQDDTVCEWENVDWTWEYGRVLN